MSALFFFCCRDGFALEITASHLPPFLSPANDLVLFGCSGRGAFVRGVPLSYHSHPMLV